MKNPATFGRRRPNAVLTRTFAAATLQYAPREQRLRRSPARAWLNSDPSIRAVAIAHQKLILDALERHDSEMARSIAMIQVDARRRWLEHLRSTPIDDDAEQLPEAAS